MRILLIEDDDLLGDGIATALRREGYAVDWARSGADALALLAAARPDLARPDAARPDAARPDAARPDIVLLDLGLPDVDGVALLQRLRARERQEEASLPVLILTARDSVEDKIRGLDAGADDYLTKPFAQVELFARLRALERRAGLATFAEIRICGVTLNLDGHTASCNGREVILSRREFTLLRALMERPGSVLTRAQLEQKLYSCGDEISSNSIDVHIHNLRKKLHPDFIKTVRGVGYLVENLN